MWARQKPTVPPPESPSTISRRQTICEMHSSCPSSPDPDQTFELVVTPCSAPKSVGRRRQGRSTHSFRAPSPGCCTALSTLMSPSERPRVPLDKQKGEQQSAPRTPTSILGQRQLTSCRVIPAPGQMAENQLSLSKRAHHPLPPASPHILCFFLDPEFHRPSRKPNLAPVGSTRIFSCIF